MSSNIIILLTSEFLFINPACILAPPAAVKVNKQYVATEVTPNPAHCSTKEYGNNPLEVIGVDAGGGA